MTTYIFNEHDKKIVEDYFFGLKNNSKQNYELWCNEIKNKPQYLENLDTHEFVFDDENKNNLITFVLSNPKLKSNINPLNKLKKINPNWNHQDKNGEHSLFHIMKKGYIFDAYCQELLKDMNAQPNLKNNKGQYFSHMMFEFESWKNLCDYKGEFENISNEQNVLTRSKEFKRYRVCSRIENIEKLMNDYPHHFTHETITTKHRDNWDKISENVIIIMKHHLVSANVHDHQLLDFCKSQLNMVSQTLWKLKLEQELSSKEEGKKVKI